jgi:small GTP-binding protein
MKTPSSLSALRSFLDTLDWSKLQAEVAGEARSRLVIAGPVNSGKSTLFNLLKGQVISPVSAVPGTTQTTIVEQFGPFTLVDTPGFGEAGGENRAALAQAEIQQAKMVLLLLDAGAGVRQSDLELYREIRAQDLPVMVVLNKVDLVRRDLRAVLSDLAFRLQGVQAIPISAKTGAGVGDRLIPAIIQADASLAVVIGRALPTYRAEAARRVIRSTAMWSFLLGAEPIPGLDLPLLLVMQARMVLRLGAIYGENVSAHYARELVSALAGGLIARYVGEELAKFLPGPGWLISAVVAATGTMTMGRLAEAFFQSGGQMDSTQITDWVRARLAKTLARSSQPIELRPRPAPAADEGSPDSQTPAR